MTVIDKYNPVLLHLFSSLVLKRNENIFDGLLKISWTFSTVPPMPKGIQGLHPARHWEPVWYLEVVGFMMAALLHSVSSFTLRTLDGPAYYLRSNHLLFLIHPLYSFPGYCALIDFHKFSADSCTVKKTASKEALFSVAALAHVISAALWDWLWKDIKVNTLLSNARL